jgi:SAM-dependent methyltransferase
MEPGEYATIFESEQRHWWYLGMQRISTMQIERFYPGGDDLRILDAGCGTGGALQFLRRFGAVTGCDLSPLALDFCRKRGLRRLARAGVGQLPFATGSFDLVTSFDVLYHRTVEDVAAALSECRRVLRPGGRLLLRLPAYDWLRGRHDRVVHTARRFTTGGVRRALVEAGFMVEKLTYANTLLFLPALARRLAERVIPSKGVASDVSPQAGRLDPLFARALYLEARWLARRNLPFGLSVMAVARKESV